MKRDVRDTKKFIPKTTPNGHTWSRTYFGGRREVVSRHNPVRDTSREGPYIRILTQTKTLVHIKEKILPSIPYKKNFNKVKKDMGSKNPLPD